MLSFHGCDARAFVLDTLCIHIWVPAAPALARSTPEYRSSTHSLRWTTQQHNISKLNPTSKHRRLSRAIMFTQALPYDSPSNTTYESITPAIRPAFPQPRRTSSLRTFSFQSVRSNISTSTASTARSSISAKSTRIKTRLHSFLRSTSKRFRADAANESDGETSLVTAQRVKKAKRVSRNPDGENMFAWAALGAYACPGAGPVVGWF